MLRQIDFKDKSIEESLDLILKCIKSGDSTNIIYQSGGKEYLSLDTQNEMIRQLIKDELIHNDIPSANKYKITIKGLLFEGYANQKNHRILAQQKQSADLKVARRSNIVLALATGILAFEAILHIVSFVHHLCH